MAIETTGHSRETGIATGRVYAAIDAGHGGFLLVFVDRDPSRLELRRNQLAALLVESRLLEHGNVVLPPQKAVEELYLKDFLFPHLVD